MLKKLKKAVTSLFDEAKRIFTATDGMKRFRFGKREAKNFKPRFALGGNMKLGKGVATWSTLMGDYTFVNLPGVLKGIKGTCQNCDGCRTSCYVRHSYFRPSAPFGHARNTYAMRTDLDRVEQSLAEQLRRSRGISLVRLNQSGEIENDEQMAMWCRLASAFPQIKFYIYTKMYNIAEKFLLNDLVPENFTVLYSVWGKFGLDEFNRVKHLPNVKAFEFDDGTGENMFLATKIYCPAYKVVGKTGKAKMDHSITCETCGLCFKGRAKVIACHDH